MLEIQRIRQEAEAIKAALAVRNFEDTKAIDQILEADEARRAAQAQLDDTQAAMNQLSKEIGQLFKSGQAEAAQKAKAETGVLKERIRTLGEEEAQHAQVIQDLLYTIPNVPHPSVPAGKSEADNEIIREHGSVPELHDEALPHWELATQYGLFDLELGVKITGAGFPVYTGKGARLQRALINYFLDKAIDAGYMEFQPPHLVNEDSARATGQLPDKEGQMYEMKADPYFLIPTAEVPLTNVYRDVILNEQDFPVKMVGYTPCFRREAGSYGKHVRGLNRVHQFDKVEIVQIQHPENSYDTLDEMVAHVEGLLQELGLPYRVARLCGGDIGFTSALTFDMEVYSAAQKRWLEVSSISNFETYQSNRLKLRYKGADKKKHLAHTLNGSALALPRILASIIENYQTPEGIKVPEVLVRYCGFDMIEAI